MRKITKDMWLSVLKELLDILRSVVFLFFLSRIESITRSSELFFLCIIGPLLSSKRLLFFFFGSNNIFCGSATLPSRVERDLPWAKIVTL